MSYASSSLRSMSTASSGLSSLSTYMPLAGGKMQDGAILYAVAAAVTVLANCDVEEMKCKDVRPVIAAALVGVVLFACKKKDCQLDLGFKKVNLQGMLLGGLVSYAAYIALRPLFSNILLQQNNTFNTTTRPNEDFAKLDFAKLEFPVIFKRKVS